MGIATGQLLPGRSPANSSIMDRAKGNGLFLSRSAVGHTIDARVLTLSSCVYSLSHCFTVISDAGTGGQVLMDEPTFRLIKDLTGELGCVTKVGGEDLTGEIGCVTKVGGTGGNRS